MAQSVKDARKVLESVGANVAALRQTKGLTQADLAERAGIDLRTVQDIERARMNSTLRMLVRVAFALEVDPFLLFERKRLLPGKRGRPTALPGRDR